MVRFSGTRYAVSDHERFCRRRLYRRRLRTGRHRPRAGVRHQRVSYPAPPPVARSDQFRFAGLCVRRLRHADRRWRYRALSVPGGWLRHTARGGAWRYRRSAVDGPRRRFPALLGDVREHRSLDRRPAVLALGQHASREHRQFLDADQRRRVPVGHVRRSWRRELLSARSGNGSPHAARRRRGRSRFQRDVLRAAVCLHGRAAPSFGRMAPSMASGRSSLWTEKKSAGPTNSRANMAARQVR